MKVYELPIIQDNPTTFPIKNTTTAIVVIFILSGNAWPTNYETRTFRHDESVYYPPKKNHEAQAIFKTHESKDGKTIDMNYYYIEGMLYDFISLFFKKGQEFTSRVYAYSHRDSGIIDLFCEEGFKNARIIGNVLHIR